MAHPPLYPASHRPRPFARPPRRPDIEDNHVELSWSARSPTMGYGPSSDTAHHAARTATIWASLQRRLAAFASPSPTAADRGIHPAVRDEGDTTSLALVDAAQVLSSDLSIPPRTRSRGEADSCDATEQKFVSLRCPLGRAGATVNEKGTSEVRTYTCTARLGRWPHPGAAGCASADRGGPPARSAPPARRSSPPSPLLSPADPAHPLDAAPTAPLPNTRMAGEPWER